MTSSNTYEVSLTEDAQLIDDVMLALAPFITTDQLPLVSCAAGIGHPDIRFLAVRRSEDKELVGIVGLLKNEIHTMFLPSLRGAAALRAGRETLAWMWANLPFDRYTSFAYSHRPEVHLFARLMGFTATETVNDGTTINGVPVLRTNFYKEKP